MMLLSLLVLVLPLSFNNAYASIQKPSVALPKPISTLQEELGQARPSSNLRALKEAYAALKARNFNQALEKASRVKKSSEYSDYGYWISAQAQLGLAQEYVRTQRYLQGLTAARAAANESLNIEKNCPFSPFLRSVQKDIARADILVGDSYWGMKKWVSAPENYERGFQRMQSQGLTSLLQLNQVEHYSEICAKKESPYCKGWLLKLLSTFPNRSPEFRAISKTHSTLASVSRPSYFPLRTTISYKAPDLDQVAFEAAMKLYSSDDFKGASKAFEDFLRDFPRSTHRYRAYYWMGETYTRLNEREKAQKAHEVLVSETPLTYYGMLATHHRNLPIDTRIQASMPLAVDHDLALQPQDLIRLKRTKELLANQIYDLAVFELREIKVTDKLSSPFLVYLAMLNAQARSYRSSFQIVGELIQRGYDGILSSYGLKLIFPDQHFAAIKSQAEKVGLDPILVLSLIKQESAFDEQARSTAGALGLMQLMPTTATETDPEVSVSALREPETNIRVGSLYLKKLMTRFGDNPVLAIAAYNAGPNAVDRWLRDTPPKHGMFEFIESIPYKETREYVGSIIRNYFWYSRQMHGPSKTLKFDNFWPQQGPQELPIKPQNGNA